MVRAGRTVWGSAIGMILFIACAPGANSPVDWALREGGTLGSIYREHNSGVVLVLDPSQCFSCTSLLAQWLEWRAAHPESFRLVLSRVPMDWERVRLAPLPVSGTLSDSPEPEPDQLPVELVFSGNELMYRSPLLRGVSTSPLLAELRDATLEEALRNITETEQADSSDQTTISPLSWGEARAPTPLISSRNLPGARKRPAPFPTTLERGYS